MKRVSEVVMTSEALAETKPKKKTKQDNKKDEHWKKLLPYLTMANKNQVENLAKDLFDELWRMNSGKAAAAVTAPFTKKLKVDRNKNHRVAGTWMLDEGGTLTIHEGIGCASFDGSLVDFEDIERISSEAADTLIYKGETNRWDNCESEFKVHLRLKYDPHKDTIKGTIKVLSCNPDPYGPSSSDGGSIEFMGQRV
eukprot:CAMPEP_0116143554 /NCGR_PEP_ID=MMETSP0329-20121206/15514_1 /TAXON_ID=697910 /ORGANISM="Pseudo-nitzschia arenysensis, Strain B593" /LENGTH=195 /DNA_ID=CAMNT_0003638885 /DNA_START=29 /DNA_END=612 /DNA_ORIENTATION=-